MRRNLKKKNNFHAFFFLFLTSAFLTYTSDLNLWSKSFLTALYYALAVYFILVNYF